MSSPAPAPIRDLFAAGQSIWLDFIRRGLLDSGELAGLVERGRISGLTSNPTIFEKAIGGSSDYDGAFDWTDHYQKGVRVMSEYDTDSDTKPNVFKYYIRSEDGSMHLDRKERDEDGDGKIDVWERFSLTGEVIRTGRDTDGDGKVDVREE